METLRSIAMQAGISSFTEEYGLALALGGGEVNLLELTAAFGIFLDGTKLDLSPIVDIQRRNDEGEWESILNVKNPIVLQGKQPTRHW